VKHLILAIAFTRAFEDLQKNVASSARLQATQRVAATFCENDVRLFL